MKPFAFMNPATVEEALAILAEEDNVKIIAGGTDLLVDMAEGRLSTASVVNIAGLRELRYIRSDERYTYLGPLTTFDDLENSPHIRDHVRALHQAAWTMGSPLIRNTATIGGNVGKASVAADGLTALCALQARVELSHRGGSRTTALEEMLHNPASAMKLDEMITRIYFETPSRNEGSAFYKLAKRKALGIVDIGGAVKIARNPDGTCRSAVLRGGALSRYPLAFTEAEAFLEGKPLVPETFEQVYGLLSQAVYESIKHRHWEVEYKKSAVVGVFRKVFAALTAGWDESEKIA